MKRSELRVGDLIVWVHGSWNKRRHTLLALYIGNGRALYWGAGWIATPDVIFDDGQTDYNVVSRVDHA